MKKAAAHVCGMVILSACANALALTEQEYNKKVEEINLRYQPTYDSASKEGDDIKRESDTCLVEGTFDADWEMTKVSFDVPEVTFKLREMSFHTVKTTFTNKTIAKTKIPKTYMEIKNVGFGIKTKVPVVRWEMEEIKTKVPEFQWGKTSLKTKIPEFKSKRLEWKFHILKIKELKELNIPCKEEKKRAEDLSASVHQTAESHRAEINKLTVSYLAERSDELADQIVATEKGFDDSLAAMDGSIADVRANGIDPAGVTIEFDGIKTTLLAARDLLAQQKTEAILAMRASHHEILSTIEAMGT